MAAVSTLVDRIYRDYLNKPDDLSAFSRLDGAMTNSQNTLSYEDGLFSVEEENLLGNSRSSPKLSKEAFSALLNSRSNIFVTCPINVTV